MAQERISNLFAQEAQQGIRIFSGGRDVVEIAPPLSQDEIDAIHYAFDTNVKKIENISPKIAAGLKLQREAMVKWAQVAKGTFPELKNYSYPGVTGGLAVDFLNPFLFRYGDSNVALAGNTDMLDIAWAEDAAVMGGDWEWDMTAGTVIYLLGNSNGVANTAYYKGCASTGAHSFVVLFQDGIVELNSSPKIQELYFKSELMDRYTPISVPPLIGQTVEEGRTIHQYTTPGMIPCSHTTGMQVAVAPHTTGRSKIVLLGMCFYETGFNLPAMVYRMP